MIQTTTNFILCSYYLLPSRLFMGKSHLKIKYHKRGLYLKKDCLTNMTVLRHEYRGGCIFRGGGWG